MQQLFKRNPTAYYRQKTHRWGENAQGGKIRVLGLKQRQSNVAKVEKTTARSQFLAQLRPGRDRSLDLVRYGHAKPALVTLTSPRQHRAVVSDPSRAQKEAEPKGNPPCCPSQHTSSGIRQEQSV